MKKITLSKETLANYLVNRSFLNQKAQSISEVMNQYHCIQVDPINVVARTHEISLWNRVESFSKEDFYKSIYEDKKYFEYWLQLYSFINIDLYPLTKPRMNVKGGWQEDYYKEHKNEIDETHKFIKTNGPTSSFDLEHIAKIRDVFQFGTSYSRSGALKYLWDTGDIMVSHRVKNRKYYDLTERIIPSDIYNENYDEPFKKLLDTYFDYYGLLRRANLSRLGYSLRSSLRDEFDKQLNETSNIVELNIEGIKTKYYVKKSQLEDLELLGKSKLHNRLNIIPPLDPLIIDRQLIEDVFDFRYRWEAYTPPAKRTFGYYGMPILYNGKFVGQVELVKNKENKKLQIKKLESYNTTKTFKNLLKNEINNLNHLAF